MLGVATFLSRKTAKVQNAEQSEQEIREPVNAKPVKTEINLNDLPPELALKLKHLDLSGDGIIDISEIASLDNSALESKRQNAFMRKMILVGAILWLLQIIAVFAVSYGAAFAATPYTLGPDGKMVSKQGGSVQTASADSCLLEGVMMARNIDGSCPSSSSALVPIKTAPSSSKSGLSSDHEDLYFESLNTVNLVSNSNHHLQLKVNGFMRNASDNNVKLYTDYGFVVLSNDSFTVIDKSDMKVFADAGFTSGQRVKFTSLDFGKMTENQRRRLAATQATSNVAGNAPVAAPAPAPTCGYYYSSSKLGKRYIAHMSGSDVVVDWASPCTGSGAATAACASAYPRGATVATLSSRTWSDNTGFSDNYHIVLAYKGSLAVTIREFDLLGIVYNEDPKAITARSDAPKAKIAGTARTIQYIAPAYYNSVVAMNIAARQVYDNPSYAVMTPKPTLGNCDSTCSVAQCLAMATAAKVYQLSGKPIATNPTGYN